MRPDQVMGETRRGRKVVLTGDTAPCDMTRLVAWEADLLVHEATFMEEDAERAAETRHSTAAQAAELAAAASVRMLALTHISPRYAGGQVRDEARARLREHDRAARLRHGRDPVPGARRACARQGLGHAAGAGAGRLTRAQPELRKSTGGGGSGSGLDAGGGAVAWGSRPGRAPPVPGRGPQAPLAARKGSTRVARRAATLGSAARARLCSARARRCGASAGSLGAARHAFGTPAAGWTTTSAGATAASPSLPLDRNPTTPGHRGGSDERDDVSRLDIVTPVGGPGQQTSVRCAAAADAATELGLS